jgi:hypothetical protein
MSLAYWCYFIGEQSPCTPLEVVAHLPSCLATPSGLMLLSCQFDSHLQRVGRCAVRMVKKLRHLARRALSEWPPEFSSMVQTARCQIAHLALLTFDELGWESPFLTTYLGACHAPSPMMAMGETMENVHAAGATAVISTTRHPVEKG